MDPDRNLRFGVQALQMGMIDAIRFVAACSAWAARGDVALPDLLLESGWIDAAGRSAVDSRLDGSSGPFLDASPPDPAAAEVDPVRHALRALVDAGGESVTSPDPAGPEDVSTMADELHLADPGRFTRTRLHAHGGIGRVWLAHDEALRRQVALKELRPEWDGDPGASARFLAEARVTGQLEHPGIVPVYELARRPEDRRPFYTMRFIEGCTLDEASRAYHRDRAAGRITPLDLRGLLGAFVKACNAVAYAHARGVIHRDLKGCNVVLGGFGDVVVLDWGLAKPLGLEARDDLATTGSVVDAGEPTSWGRVMGTPAYMAPEQAAGEPGRIGPWTDVHGLGAILYEILTGRPPFGGPDTAEVLRQVREEPPARPRRLVPATPPALEAICLKALAKAPEDRYGSAEELTHDVECWLADEPVSAYREPWPARAWRWARHHRPLVSGVASLLVTGVVALAAGAILLGRAHAQTERALARAEEGLRTTVKAIDQFFVQVGDKRLNNQPGADELRKELLRSAVAFYEDLARRNPDDPALQAELGKAHYHLGHTATEFHLEGEATAHLRHALDITERLARASPDEPGHQVGLSKIHGELAHVHHVFGRQDQAEASAKQGIAIEERLVHRHPKRSDYLLSLAQSHVNLTIIYHVGERPAEATSSIRRAVEILERLATDHPGEDRYRREWAVALMELAFNGNALGRFEEAEATYRRAIAVLEPLARAHPDDPGYREDLGSVHTNLGSLYSDAGRPADAEESFLKGLDISKKFAREYPLRPGYAVRLGGDYCNLGYVALKRGAIQAAIKWYAEATETLKAALQQDPADSLAKTFSRNTAHGYAQALADLGDFTEAFAVIDQALAIDEASRRDPDLMARRAAILARQRQFREALKAAEPLEGPDQRSAYALYDLAAVYSLGSAGDKDAGASSPADRERHAAHAVELLKRAGRVFPHPGRLAREAKADRDFDPIRDRGDFRAWLKELERPRAGSAVHK